MILPDVRASFGRAEAAFVVGLLTRAGDAPAEAVEERLRDEGFDALLDDPRTLNALMTGEGFSGVRPALVFYVLVRHALLEGGISDRVLADYLTTLLLVFGQARRAYRADEDDAEFFHLADLVAEGDRADGHRAFLLRSHLGEFALWLTGLFPDHITARVQRRGAPGLAYYEELGARGYRLAADHRDAERHGLDRVYLVCAETFPHLRVALNRLADRHLFPARGDRIDRLLRQVSDRVRLHRA
jgi:hypothetical protein